jgi:integrase
MVLRLHASHDAEPVRKNRGVLKGAKSREEAEKLFAEIKPRILNGLPPIPEPVAPVVVPDVDTVESHARKWIAGGCVGLRHRGRKKPSTIGFCTDNVENYIIPALGSMPITLTRSQCKAFVIQVRNKPKLSQPTKIGIVITLGALLSAAVDDDDCPITSNPAAGLRGLVVDHKTLKSKALTKDQYFERDEVTEMLTAARDHFLFDVVKPKSGVEYREYLPWYPLILFGFRAGLRQSELFGLKWGDIDWRKGFVHVQRAWVQGAWTTPKNWEDRPVDMSRQLRTELRLWRRRQRENCLRAGLGQPDLVFPSSVGTPLDDSNVRKVFTAIVKKADPRHRNFKAMRHTFVSLLLQNGESLAYVQKQAGHKNPEITLNVYGHFIPGGNRNAVDRLDVELPPATRPTTFRIANSA